MASSRKSGSIHYGVVVLMVVAIAFLIVYFGFASSLWAMMKGAGPEEACRLSVLAKARSRFLGVESPLPLKGCETNYLTSNAADKDAVMKELAEELRKCWHQFYEGEADFLGSYDFGSSDVKCYVCSEVRFDQYRGHVDTAEFSAYLQQHQLTGQQNTYWNYLFKNTTTELRGSGEGFEVGGDQVTYVTFVGSKLTGKEQWFGVFGDAIRFLFIKKEFARGVGVMHGEKAAENCDALS